MTRGCTELSRARPPAGLERHQPGCRPAARWAGSCSARSGALARGPAQLIGERAAAAAPGGGAGGPGSLGAGCVTAHSRPASSSPGMGLELPFWRTERRNVRCLTRVESPSPVSYPQQPMSCRHCEMKAIPRACVPTRARGTVPKGGGAKLVRSILIRVFPRCRSRHLCFVLKVAIDARGQPGEGKWQDGGSHGGGVQEPGGAPRRWARLRLTRAQPKPETSAPRPQTLASGQREDSFKRRSRRRRGAKAGGGAVTSPNPAPSPDRRRRHV